MTAHRPPWSLASAADIRALSFAPGEDERQRRLLGAADPDGSEQHAVVHHGAKATIAENRTAVGLDVGQRNGDPRLGIPDRDARQWQAILAYENRIVVEVRTNRQRRNVVVVAIHVSGKKQLLIDKLGGGRLLDGKLRRKPHVRSRRLEHAHVPRDEHGRRAPHDRVHIRDLKQRSVGSAEAAAA